MIVILMGVTGSGKTTVGRLLAGQLGWMFIEGDDFHPQANVEKLKRGVALTDQEREPWLKAIGQRIRSAMEQHSDAVVACSALKQSYRRALQVGEEVVFVYLKADAAVLRERLKARTGHFMNPGLLQSQLDTLEEPDDGLRVDASLPPAEIVRQIRDGLEI